jgi:hypothetical protein
VVSNQVSLIAVQAGGLQARSEDATTVETARRIRTLAAATCGRPLPGNRFYRPAVRCLSNLTHLRSVIKRPGVCKMCP